jgi:mannose-6-phosphate isomerase-like protein (cupin superfamily)
MKVKELTVEPGKSLSMQRHFKRSEHWIVSEGNCEVNYILDEKYFSKTLNTHGIYQVPLGEWHQLCNLYDEPCRIVEVQYGESCIEEDIERK